MNAIMKTENKPHDEKVCEMSFEIIKDKIINEITETAMCLGKSIENAITLHTSIKFANYLQNKKKWVKFYDIDNFFIMLQQHDLGDIFGLSYSYLCKHFAMYEAHLKAKKTMINEVKHDEIRQIEENEEFVVSGSFEAMFNENPNKNIYKYPYLYGIIIAKLTFLEKEKIKDFEKRALRHFEKNY